MFKYAYFNVCTFKVLIFSSDQLKTAFQHETRIVLNETSLFSLSLSLFFLNSQHHETTNVARKRGAARVICRIIVPMYTSLFPSPHPPKLYINYALFRTRPARLYFRSNRKTTPQSGNAQCL